MILFSFFPRCAVIKSIAAGDTMNFECNGMAGRFVNIVIPGQKKILTLCEVEVFGVEYGIIAWSSFSQVQSSVLGLVVLYCFHGLAPLSLLSAILLCCFLSLTFL